MSVAWRTDANRAHFGAEAPENKPHGSHQCRQCPCAPAEALGLAVLSSCSKELVHVVGEEQLAISLYQGSTRISSEVAVCLSVLFLLPCPNLQEILFSPSKKKYGLACTWDRNLSSLCQMGKSLSLPLRFRSVGNRQTRGSSVAVGPAERGWRWCIPSRCAAGG